MSKLKIEKEMISQQEKLLRSAKEPETQRPLLSDRLGVQMLVITGFSGDDILKYGILPFIE